MSVLTLLASSTVLARLKQGAGHGMARQAPGTVLVGAMALGAVVLAQVEWFHERGVSAVIVSLFAGALLGNLLPRAASGACAPGIGWSRHSLLRAAIVLYGFRITLRDFEAIGAAAIVVDAALLVTTFGIAVLTGKYLIKMDTKTALLIGAGSSICGAAAIIATEPVVKAKAEQVTVAVATVVLFGSLAIVIYPWLYRQNQAWQILSTTERAFGIYIGSTVHEVAQVIAAAKLSVAASADTAVIAKMGRVMMLPIFLVALSLFTATQASRPTGQTMPGRMRSVFGKISLPWFAGGFMLAVFLNSTPIVSPDVRATLAHCGHFLMCMGMAALGLTTHYSCFRRAGGQAVLLGAILFAWLVVGGAWINYVAAARLG